MPCNHQGFHAFTSSYDRRRRILAYIRTCEDCGARLAEVDRLPYEPRFDPRGSDLYRTGPQLETAGGAGR